LSLDFSRGTDSKIREYLGERLKRSHLECEKLTATIKSVESEIAALKQDFQQSQAELDRLRREKSEQVNSYFTIFSNINKTITFGLTSRKIAILSSLRHYLFSNLSFLLKML
jgi:hypothetical protein